MPLKHVQHPVGGIEHAGELARLHAAFSTRHGMRRHFQDLLSHPGSTAFLARRRDRAARTAWASFSGRLAADEAEILTLGVAGTGSAKVSAGRLVEKRWPGGQEGASARRLYLEVAAEQQRRRSRLYQSWASRRSGGARATTSGPARRRRTRVNLALGARPLCGAWLRLWPGGDVTYNGHTNTLRTIRTCGIHVRFARTSATRIEQLCADKRLRMTGQRRVIARVLSDGQGPPRRGGSAPARPRRRFAHLALDRLPHARLFAAKGILERHDFGAGRGRYEEAARSHHDHLIDIETGRVIEFSNEEIERIQQRVARELGFSWSATSSSSMASPAETRRASQTCGSPMLTLWKCLGPRGFTRR